MARGLVREWPERAEKLAGEFWPGPLTLVLPKQPHVPDRLTAGLDTVGVRMPANPIALALIRGGWRSRSRRPAPIASPSFHRPPRSTCATLWAIASRWCWMADRTTVGIESTVLSLAGPEAVLLRPGMVSQQEIEAVIGPVQALQQAPEGAHASPGLHARHYSPKTPLILVEPGASFLRSAAESVFKCQPIRANTPQCFTRDCTKPMRPGWDWIAIERPPGGEEWSAIRDRLERASYRS